jgi:RNA polymerase sigma factor (sigma-70 family)
MASKSNSKAVKRAESGSVRSSKPAPKKAAVKKAVKNSATAKKAVATKVAAKKAVAKKAAPPKKAAPKTSAKRSSPKAPAKGSSRRATAIEMLDDIELVDDSDTGSFSDVLDIEVVEEIDDIEIEIEEEPEEVVPEPIDYNDENTVLFTERNRIRDDLERATAVPERRRSVGQQRRISRLRREMDDITTKIVKFNYGLVRSYTKKFTSNSSREDSADFEASAVVGLMRAIDSFDPTKGRFGAWAYKPIQREVLRAVRDADFKSMNPGDFERRPDILRAVTKLQAGDETKMPSNAAIAAEARVTVDQVRRVLEAPHLESIHQHVGDDGGTELGDLIESDTTRVEGAVLSSMTLTALEDYGFKSLDDRELFVLVRRFGLDSEPEQKLASIGDMLGLSREAVRQVEAKALSKLMHPTILRKIVRYGRA